MIEIKNISKSYKNGKADIKALKDVSIHITKGELFGLIGPDGAGKTTLLRILATLLLADKGTGTMNNMDVVKDYKQIRNIIGYMPGRFSLYHDLSVEENLRFFATIFRTTMEENHSLIKDIYEPLAPFKNRKAGNLSGGMKQKLALSCALIHKPAILILDEPTTGVDVVSRKEFWQMLRKLKQEGLTILVATPYMDEANLCDRIALIQEGRILDIDSPQNMVSKHKHVLWAIKANNMYAMLQDLRQSDAVESAFLFGEYCHITPRDKQADAGALKEWLITRGHSSVSLQTITPGIEDIFMQLMQTPIHET
jgi:ABC-type multidrug transport system ATPase subunit